MSENVNILKCECLMSKDEEERYDKLISNGRFVCLMPYGRQFHVTIIAFQVGDQRHLLWYHTQLEAKFHVFIHPKPNEGNFLFQFSYKNNMKT